MRAVPAELAAAEVHVFTAVPEQDGAPEARARCEDMLSADERARMQRFRFEHDRHTYLVAHALVRVALSRYAACAPPAWRFTAGAHGRPEIAPGTCERPLRFNLSHTRGLVAVAIALERDVGLDVEHMYPRSFDLAVARHFFAPPEVAALEALPAEAQRDRFFAYWTLKEAYIKARGLGLAMPLDRFAFDLDRPDDRGGDSPDNIVLSVDRGLGPGLDDDGSAWWFHQRVLTPEHRLAVALQRRPGEAVALRIASISPGAPDALA